MTRTKTRVVVLVPTMMVGGVEQCTSLLLKHFSRDFFDLELVTIFDRPPFFEIPSNVRLHILEKTLGLTRPNNHVELTWGATGKHIEAMLWLETVASKFGSLVSEIKPDVILAQDLYATVIALMAKKEMKTAPKIVGTVHILCSSFLQQVDFGDLFAHLLRQYLKDADAIVAVGNSLAIDLIRNFGARQNQVTVIRNPFDFEEVERLSHQSLDEDWSLYGQIPTVLFVGRLTHQKGLAYLVQAIALARKLQEVRCVIVGDGEERDMLQASVEMIGIAPNVTFLGRVENAFKYMRVATCLVLPSLVEAIPYVVIEAMACGCPVIATKSSPDLEELLGDNERGILVPPRNSYALAEAILRVVGDKNLRKQIAEAGMRHVKHFDTSSAMLQYERLLRS
jgi:glycosyltransferase involved in cell wall biosynthesis